MNKKFYLGALALPLIMAACSSEDTLSEVQGVKDQYEGIAKVDATFAFEGTQSRLAKEWNLEEGDKIGMAWLGVPEDEKYGVNYLPGTGWAYQNHPLKATGTGTLKPETSIYVGKYFIYYPYDAKTQQLKNIQFNLGTQPLSEEYKDAAINSLWLSSELTDVTIDGDINENNKAGEACTFTVKARQLSNAVGLEATWLNNDIIEKEISAPVIDSIMVGYSVNGQVVSATGLEYAPKDFENGFSSEYETYNSEGTTNTGRYWGHFNLFPSEKPESRVAAEVKRDFELLQPGIPATGFENIQRGLIKLAKEGGYTVQGESAKFYYNALPATTTAEDITMRVLTDFGVIDYTLPMNEAAMTVDYRKDNATGYMEGFDGPLTLVGSENGVEITTVPADGSFMNRLFKSGKILANIDFFDAKINGMHVKNDVHLQKLLKFFKLKIENGNTTEAKDVVLYLDADSDDEFKISKTSIALLQSINAEDMKVTLHVCKKHGNPIVVVKQFNAEEGKEVPEFTRVFGHLLPVYLEAQDWTWNETAAKNTGKVTTIYNRGNLTIGSTNVEVNNKNLNEIVNLEDASITFTANVATLWKVNLTNNGTIDIPATAHMRVYSNVVNNVTEVTGVRTGNMGIIDNYGVFGAVEDQNGSINNYGKIYHRAGAKTFITNNEENEDFSKTLAQGTKIGIIEMTEADANVSVSNTSDKGIITYKWSKDEPVYVSPAVVRYNYLIVEGNIEFTEKEAEIRYLEINGADVYVNNKGYLSSLQAVIVDKNNALNITEGNKLKPAKAAYLKGYVYNGGEFTYNNDVVTYFGGVDADKENILKWSGF